MRNAHDKFKREKLTKTKDARLANKLKERDIGKNSFNFQHYNKHFNKLTLDL